MTEYKLVFGTEQSQPEIFDTKSSPTTVYQRKNIQKVEKADEFGTVIGWERLEREMTFEEYNNFKPYIIENEILESKITDLQLALCSLYESVTK